MLHTRYLTGLTGMQMKLASPHAQILLLKVIILSSSKSVHNSSDGSKNQITCFCAVSAAGETIPLINAYLQRYEKLCARSIIGSLLQLFLVVVNHFSKKL